MAGEPRIRSSQFLDLGGALLKCCGKDLVSALFFVTCPTGAMLPATSIELLDPLLIHYRELLVEFWSP